MTFSVGSYVELRKFPNVVWRIAEPPRFNGGYPIFFLQYVGADSQERGDWCRRKKGLAPKTFKTTAQFDDLVEANPVLVLALESRCES
jgi:hypothetical protein